MTLLRRLQRAWASRPWVWDGFIGLPPYYKSAAHKRWQDQGFPCNCSNCEWIEAIARIRESKP